MITIVEFTAAIHFIVRCFFLTSPTPHLVYHWENSPVAVKNLNIPEKEETIVSSAKRKIKFFFFWRRCFEVPTHKIFVQKERKSFCRTWEFCERYAEAESVFKFSVLQQKPKWSPDFPWSKKKVWLSNIALIIHIWTFCLVDNFDLFTGSLHTENTSLCDELASLLVAKWSSIWCFRSLLVMVFIQHISGISWLIRCSNILIIWIKSFDNLNNLLKVLIVWTFNRLFGEFW